MVVGFVAKEFFWVNLSKGIWPVNKLLRAAVVERNLEVTGVLLAPNNHVLQLLVPVEVVLAIVLRVQIFQIVVKLVLVESDHQFSFLLQLARTFFGFNFRDVFG